MKTVTYRGSKDRNLCEREKKVAYRGSMRQKVNRNLNYFLGDSLFFDLCLYLI
jgi:hypothetical protein